MQFFESDILFGKDKIFFKVMHDNNNKVYIHDTTIVVVFVIIYFHTSSPAFFRKYTMHTHTHILYRYSTLTLGEYVTCASCNNSSNDNNVRETHCIVNTRSIRKRRGTKRLPGFVWQYSVVDENRTKAYLWKKGKRSRDASSHNSIKRSVFSHESIFSESFQQF